MIMTDYKQEQIQPLESHSKPAPFRFRPLALLERLHLGEDLRAVALLHGGGERGHNVALGADHLHDLLVRLDTHRLEHDRHRDHLGRGEEWLFIEYPAPWNGRQTNIAN